MFHAQASSWHDASAATAAGATAREDHPREAAINTRRIAACWVRRAVSSPGGRYSWALVGAAGIRLLIALFCQDI
jgi:hypothetical protein